MLDKIFASGSEDVKLIQKTLKKKQTQQDALTFFRKNVAHIQIVRENEVFKVIPINIIKFVFFIFFI